MARFAQSQVGSLRWFTGWLALGLVVFIQLQSAFLATVIWFATHHGHDHGVVVQTDGNHLDVRLSHDHDHNRLDTEHHHETSASLIAALYSTHEHEDNDHVLHFLLNETPDQIRQRNIITAAPSPAPPVAIAAISFICPPPNSAKSAAAIPPESPPPLTAGLLGLRTTVLLV